ncbi:MAG TPA: TetR/AcrR family transcriptional regulator [Burkholderiales bacterium]|nr:TetR/AcrR family transcriptional regulator [Burkholderiales bacterium]
MATQNRERVLRAATTSFLARGYASSVDDIARRAGVAKQTVYSHFPSKDLLFREVARELALSVLVELEGGDLRAALVRFGLAYRQRALGAQGIATFRTLVPEVPRFKNIAKSMYADTVGAMVERLAQYLGTAMRDGRLRRDDAELAAEMFLSMLAGVDRVKRLFCVANGVEKDQRRTARIVDCFLRAYKP